MYCQYFTYIYMYNIANVGWQLIQYTVYETLKGDNYCFSSSRKLYSGLAAIQYLYNIGCVFKQRKQLNPDIAMCMPATDTTSVHFNITKDTNYSLEDNLRI